MSADISVDTVDGYLEHYGNLVRERLIGYLPTREPRSSLYDLVTDYPMRPSKMLRASMCIASCRAHGGSLDQVLDSAVAIELLHNAFMVHDDIEDGSVLRRGRPTLHVEHGVPIALNVGDSLAFLSLGPLIDNATLLGDRVAWSILHEFLDVVTRTVEGQAMELGWTRDQRFDITDRDYLKMVVLKTCWYTTILPCRVGRLVATGSVGEHDLVRFGTYFGASFQIRDDVLNLDGDLAEYGKEIGGDVTEGKRTMILAHLLRSCSVAERDEVMAIYSRPVEGRSEADVGRVIELMREYRSIDHAVAGANGLAGAALSEFDQEFGELPDSADVRFLRELVLRSVIRTR
jgi:geranylgeranyl diphosphate synthase type II